MDHQEIPAVQLECSDFNRNAVPIVSEEQHNIGIVRVIERLPTMLDDIARALSTDSVPAG